MAGGYAQSSLRGAQRIPTPQPGNSAAKIWNTPGDPTDDVGINGDFAVNTTTWTIFGPKTNGTWAGTATALKNNKVPKIYWDFTGAADPNNNGQGYVFTVLNDSTRGFKPGDFYFFGPSTTSPNSYVWMWVNTESVQGTPANFIGPPGNWFLLLVVGSGSGSGGGDGGTGGAGGGDGGE